MNIRLIVVGKTDIPFVQQGVDEYLGRLKHYVGFELVVIPSLKNVGRMSSGELKEKEGDLILKQTEKADVTILLDEHGKEYTSVGFSEYLGKQMNAGIKTLAFVIGGAYGFSPAVHAAANGEISLSRMTFNHQMVRLFFVEQLYRAYTILHHEKYHNE